MACQFCNHPQDATTTENYKGNTYTICGDCKKLATIILSTKPNLNSLTGDFKSSDHMKNMLMYKELKADLEAIKTNLGI